MKRIQAVVIPFVLVAALAGCTPEAAPTPTPTATATPTTSAAPTPTATPTPTAEPAAALVVPGCETLLSLDQLKSVTTNQSVEFLGERSIDDLDSQPWIETAMRAGDPTRLCAWGRPNSDGGVRVYVAGLASTDRDALMASLTAEGYSSVTMGTVTGMEKEVVGDSEQGGTYLFTGEAWIGVPGFVTSFTGSVAGIVLDSLRTANPGLGL